MKTTTKLLAFLFLLSSLSITYGQETQSRATPFKGSKNSERKGWDGSVKGGNIHIDINNNGNRIIVIPTSPKPTVLELNTEGSAFAVDNSKNPTSGMASEKEAGSGMASGRNLDDLNGLIRITKITSAEKGIKEKGLSNKGIREKGLGNRTADENGDVDIAMLESGDYTACYGKACFNFSYDAVKGKVKNIPID